MNNGLPQHRGPYGGRDSYSEPLTYEQRKNLPLSAAELKLYDLFVESGWSNRKLSAAVGATEGTVKVQMSHIMHFFGVEDRCELLANALWGKIRGLETDLEKQKEVAA